MKAFIIALLLIAGIAVGANYALDEAGFSSAETYQSANVRLGE